MPGQNVRKQFMKRFRGLSLNSRVESSLIVTSFIAQVLGAMGIGYWLLQQPLSLFSVLALSMAMFFIGTRLRGFNNIVHECSHSTFTRRREDNPFFGSLCASLVLSSFGDYRDEHMTHHQHLGDYDRDLDLQGIQDFRLEDPLTPATILRHFMTPILGLHLPYYLSINLSARDGIWFQALKIGLISGAVLFLIADPLAALLLVWIPFVWVYSAINYWTDCIDHGGLVHEGDELECSRNFLIPKQFRALLFPRNDCYHLIHHLFPQIPAHHFEACHKQLMDNPEYQARNIGKTAPAKRPSLPDTAPVEAARI